MAALARWCFRHRWIVLAVWLVALYVQRSTYFGRDVYAVGVEGGSPGTGAPEAIWSHGLLGT